MRQISVQAVVCEPKNISTVNEDEILIGTNIYGVFDGATSLTGYVNPDDLTGGKLAAQIACRTFAENNCALGDAAITANRRIRKAMEDAGVDINLPETLWATSAIVVRIVGKMVEFFHIGDCGLLGINKRHRYAFIAEPHNHERGLIIMCRNLVHQGIQKASDIRAKLIPEIKKLRGEMNRTYGVLNGDPKAETFFNRGFAPGNIRTFILFSDGLAIPKKDPKASDDWALFIQLYRDGGLSNLLSYVRALENSDPECQVYPRPKPHDDASGIALSFS